MKQRVKQRREAESEAESEAGEAYVLCMTSLVVTRNYQETLEVELVELQHVIILFRLPG